MLRMSIRLRLLKSLQNDGSSPRSVLSSWLPVVAWAAVIFVFSSIPSLSTHLGVWDLLLRKLAHGAEYAVLGALLARAIQRPLLAWTIGLLYAASDEVHQHFVSGRHASPVDVAIDAVGVTLGVLAWNALVGQGHKARSRPA
jgi:VanZ family protein